MFYSYDNSAYFLFLIKVVKVPLKKILLDLASHSSSCCSNFDPRKIESDL